MTLDARDAITILDMLQQGGDIDMSPEQALSLLDIARQNRWTLHPVAVQKLQAAIAKTVPDHLEYGLDVDGTQIRHVIKVAGAKTSLDD